MSDRPLGTYLDRIRTLAPLVREHAGTSEQDARLATPLVEAMHDAGLFRLFLPARLGGGELGVPESLRVFEAVARLDASAGWNACIGASGPLFGHFVSRDAYEAIFADPRALVAGTLNPLTTQVVASDRGWRFSGKATYVSGSPHATWLMSAGIELRDGAPQLVDGVPVMRTGIFPMAQARMLDTWRVAGMRATGSNDCVFEDVLVPDAFTFEWPNPRSPWQGGAFGQVPLATQLGAGLASVALGAARHAIDALIDIAGGKIPTGTRATLRERPLAQMQLAQAEGWLQAGRAYLFDAMDAAWRQGEAGAPFGAPERAAARLASVTAAKLAAMAVDVVHEASGMNAVQTAGDLERCWRDVHTITQHVILGAGRYEIIGRIMLGLDAGSPII